MGNKTYIYYATIDQKTEWQSELFYVQALLYIARSPTASFTLFEVEPIYAYYETTEKTIVKCGFLKKSNWRKDMKLLMNY